MRGSSVPHVASHLASSPRASSIANRSEDRLHVALPLPELVIAVALPVISQCPPTWVGGSSAVLASAVAQPVSTQTSTVSDPVGDANFNAPAFQDVVLVQMTKTAGGDFELLMEMAGPVPVDPAHATTWHTTNCVGLELRLGPHHISCGLPLPPGHRSPAEFSVYVSWDGTAFAGTAIDRRPLLTGGEAVITPVTFSINGTIVQADLPYALIGDVPASFGWFAGTGDWSGPVGSSAGHHLVDVAIFNP